MKRRIVVFAPEARDDIVEIYDRISDLAGSAVALAYIARVEKWCLALDLAPERGRKRDDIRPGLRVIGFERRLTVAITVNDANVTVLRLFGAGRDWEQEFDILS